MALDPAIALQAGQGVTPLQDPIQRASQFAQLQNMQQQNQLGGIQVQQGQLALQDQQIQAEWAAAMADVAIEFTANIAGLPPAERQEASRRAALLSTCANELLSGSVPPDLESAIGPALAQLRVLQSARAPQRSPIGRSRTA